MPLLASLSIYSYVKGQYALAYERAEQLLQLGQQAEDPLMIQMGNWCLGIVSFMRGEYLEARRYLEQVVSFYVPHQHHRPFVLLRGVDVGLSAMAYLTCCLWCLGYPEQALKLNRETLRVAYEINQAFTLADVLRYAGCETAFTKAGWTVP